MAMLFFQKKTLPGKSQSDVTLELFQLQHMDYLRQTYNKMCCFVEMK